jgi:hypothetical protein
MQELKNDVTVTNSALEVLFPSNAAPNIDVRLA